VPEFKEDKIEGTNLFRIFHQVQSGKHYITHQQKPDKEFPKQILHLYQADTRQVIPFF